MVDPNFEKASKTTGGSAWENTVIAHPHEGINKTNSVCKEKGAEGRQTSEGESNSEFYWVRLGQGLYCTATMTCKISN